MKKSNKINIDLKIAEIVNRKRAKDQGFYDGRFRTRVIPNKKKTIYLKIRKNKKIF